MTPVPTQNSRDNSEFSAFESSLTTVTFGRPFHYHASLESTNTFAMELARRGAPEGTLVLADSQTVGRGRMGRRWVSPPAKSLLFSLILRPSLPAQSAAQTTLLMSLAVANVLREKAGVDAEIKWPNDVLIRGKKVCGILVEMEGALDRLDFLVAGLGINVNQDDRDWPAELEPAAVSLRQETGRILDRAELLKELMNESERLYGRLLRGEFSALLQEWQAMSCMTGRQVRARLAGRDVLGMAIGLDPDGALQVRLDNGIIERIVAGDVELIRTTGT
jgi:BirA family biotin operon repressor/biotin-[acetyl-CoA-carboxylase] ligase